MKKWATYRGNGICWFRLFGAGVCVEDRRKIKAPFYERNGFSRVLRIGPIAFAWLRKYPT